MKIRHIGLIPDGNRRWADANALPYNKAYRITMQNIVKMIIHLSSKDIRSLSIYLLSTENLKRNRYDLGAVLDAETYLLQNLIAPIVAELQSRVIHAGNPYILPERLSSSILELCDKTKIFDRRFLYLLIGYSPFEEISHALQTSQKSQIDITDLWVPERVDLIIRTAGGPPLLSNFLPLQSGYAQICMVDKYFNDLREEELDRILEEAAKVKMLYGK